MKDVLDIPGIDVVFDSKVGREFFIKHKNMVYVFKQCKRGLFYCDISLGKEAKPKETVNKYSILQSVKENEFLFSKKDVQNAKEVTDIQKYFFLAK